MNYRLRISKFSSEDAGTYQCVSSNSLGSDQEVIRIYGELKANSFETVYEVFYIDILT